MGKIITVAGHKGGIGKSTVLCSLCVRHQKRKNSLFPGNRLAGKHQGFHRGT